MTRQKGNNLLLFPTDCCIIDIETTGLDPEYCEIIEIAALRIRNGDISDRFSELVKPSEPLDTFITALTGITNDMLKDAAQISDVLPAFRAFIGNDLLVGHNVHFDINFLYDSSEQLHLNHLSNDFIDTMRIARIVLPDMEHHRLNDLARHFQIINPQEHRAEGDCLATLELLRRLKTEALSKGIDLSQYQRKRYSGVRAKDLSAQTDTFDKSHPLFGKMCAFTGALCRMTRREAMQLVLNVGGSCGDSVTRKTDFLIIGNTEYISNLRNGKTEKMRKAEELILKGIDLTIISESVFYDLVDGYDRPLDESGAETENGNYDQLIRWIKDISHQTAYDLNTPDDFFDLVENQKSHSLWIIEPMTKARSQMVFTIEKRGKAGSKYGRLLAKKSLLDKIEAKYFMTATDPTLCYLDIDELKDEYIDLIRRMIRFSADHFTPAERFGCCHLYRECSAAKRCLHYDLFYAKACWYRKNLESGNIFY